MSLTPALAVEHPEVAAVVPWLMVVGMAMILGAVVASVSLSILGARRSKADGEALALLRDVDFKNVGRRLLVAHRALRALAVLVFVTWAVPYVLGQTGRATTELVFVVIYACLFAPVYVVTRVLASAFQRLGVVVESHGP